MAPELYSRTQPNIPTVYSIDWYLIELLKVQFKDSNDNVDEETYRRCRPLNP